MGPTTQQYDHITGVILAGGKSTRMGRDKAQLEIAGVTFFENILGLMKKQFSHVLIAGDRPDLEQSGVASYPDLYPGSALGGLYTGLLKSKHEMIFASSCDIPFPSQELIRLIVSHRHGYDVVVPQTPYGLEPLFALYHKNCLGFMREMLERNEYRIYDFYPQVQVLYINMENQSLEWRRSLMNVNTPEEYGRIKERTS